MESIWSKEVEDTALKNKVAGDIQTEVLVIGGGMAGILCAYQLMSRGIDCLLVEKHRMCSGNTRNTTAKITAQHQLIYNRLIRSFGEEKARQYYDINTRGLKEFRRLANEISCDYEEKTAYVYSCDDKAKLEAEAEAYEKLKIPYLWEERCNLPFFDAGAVGMPGQAQFHPLKFTESILSRLDYSEETFVTEIQGNKAVTENGSITANHIILATHYPMVNVPGLYFMKLVQQRSYVLALAGAPELDGMYIEAQKDGYSFRNYGDLLLLGGGGHKTGKHGGGWHRLSDFAAANCPQATEVAAWAAQDCITLDQVPYVGIHRRKAGNLYIAAGFNKWGMTGSMSAALVLAELIADGKSHYQELFSPQRSIIHPKLFANVGAAALHLITPGRRCSHLGCRLTWNEAERSWDCPCHGSRFDDGGQVLDNPAKKGISYEK